MTIINVGACHSVTRDNYASKKALRTALEMDPDSVVFYETTMGREHYNYYIGDIAESDITFLVVGPDPYTSRRWYANVSHNGTRVVVK